MTHQFSPAVEQLIRDKMATGRYRSENELVAEALQMLDDRETDLGAMQEGLAELDRGEKGVPLDEAVQRLRQKYQK